MGRTTGISVNHSGRGSSRHAALARVIWDYWHDSGESWHRDGGHGTSVAWLKGFGSAKARRKHRKGGCVKREKEKHRSYLDNGARAVGNGQSSCLSNLVSMPIGDDGSRPGAVGRERLDDVGGGDYYRGFDSGHNRWHSGR